MKKIILSALLVAGILPLSAQNSNVEEKVEYSTDTYKVETNTFWHNWFITVGGGTQVYFGDHDRQVDFGKRLAPALDLAVGKWFTPGIGVRLMYSGLQVKGATQKGALSHSTGDDVPGKGGNGYWLEKQKFNMSNVHADVMFNLSNLFCGYNEKRVWNVSPYFGLGWAHVGEEPKFNDITANFGILNSWRLCDALNLNLDVRGAIVNDEFDGERGGSKGEGLLTATLGLSYKFKQRGWNRSKTVVRYDNTALNEMREKLNRISEENDRLKRALAEGNKQEVRTIIKKMAAANLVTFKIGKSKLSNEARVNLGMLAEVIKQGDKDIVYTITGYADAGTGSKSINERLSKERAQVVYDCLVKEFGVSQSQLRIDYKSGVDNMFYNDPRLSRAVITRGE